jgi:hypothetical protein
VPEEGIQQTRHPVILVGQQKAHDWALLTRQREELRALAEGGELARLLDKVKEVVPELRLDCRVKGEAVDHAVSEAAYSLGPPKRRPATSPG